MNESCGYEVDANEVHCHVDTKAADDMKRLYTANLKPPLNSMAFISVCKLKVNGAKNV